MLGGLIKAEDAKSISGLPWLSEAPLVGRLFGVHSDSRSKSEIVLLITPHVVRNLQLPDAHRSLMASGVDANPAAEGVRLRPRAQVALPLAGSVPAAPGSADGAGAEDPAGKPPAVLQLAASEQVVVGDVAAVTLVNRTALTVEGELVFDPSLWAPAQAGAAGPGRLPFKLGPRGGQGAYMLRALPSAAGQTTRVSVGNLVGRDEGGGSQPVSVSGEVSIAVER